MVIRARLKPFIPLILSLLLALILYLIVDDFVEQVIVVPLLYVIWFVNLIVQSLPQAFIWVSFVFLLLILSYFSIRKREAPRSSVRVMPATNSGQVERWTRFLENAQTSRFAKWRLANEFKRLTRELLSEREDGSNHLRQAALNLPLEIHQYFEAPQPTQIPKWISKEQIETPLDLDPEIVIQYLEEQLRQ